MKSYFLLLTIKTTCQIKHWKHIDNCS